MTKIKIGKKIIFIIMMAILGLGIFSMIVLIIPYTSKKDSETQYNEHTNLKDELSGLVDDGYNANTVDIDSMEFGASADTGRITEDTIRYDEGKSKEASEKEEPDDRMKVYFQYIGLWA